MIHYVTVADKNYLPKALALYESILEKSQGYEWDFTLCCIDNVNILYEMPKNVERFKYTCPDWVVSQETLKHIRTSRTYQEYCWSLASIVTSELMYAKHIDEPLEPIIYLDSDVYFFNNPKIILDYINKPVAVSPHNFLEEDYNRLRPNGLINVSYMYFDGSPKSCWILDRWADDVENKCSATEGCGDQAVWDEYLNDDGDNISLLSDGMLLGPWNIRGYETYLNDYHDVFVRRVPDGIQTPLVAMHFHAHWRGNKDIFIKGRTGGYPLTEENIQLIYEPYEKVLEKYERLQTGS